MNLAICLFVTVLAPAGVLSLSDVASTAAREKVVGAIGRTSIVRRVSSPRQLEEARLEKGMGIAAAVKSLEEEDQDEEEKIAPHAVVEEVRSKLWDARQASCSWGYREQISEDVLRYKIEQGTNWGNRLSGYWEARATALISGRKFSTNHVSFHSSWLQYLPTEVPPRSERENLTAYENACTSCKACGRCDNGRNPHHCGNAAWTHIRDVLQVDTHAAMRKFEEAHPEQKPQGVLQDHGDGAHVLFHVRLEFVHPQISWPAKSFFEGKLPRHTRRITLLHMPYLSADNHVEANGGHVHKEYSLEEQSNITALLNGYNALLSALCQGCVVSAHVAGQYEAWATIARHRGPIFCMGSSFCLWAGLANEHGPIHFPANFLDTTHANVSGGKGLGLLWHSSKMLSNLNISAGFNTRRDLPFHLMRASNIVEWVGAN
jgi:hypothetical protein